jgi:hypothetical protein
VALSLKISNEQEGKGNAVEPGTGISLNDSFLQSHPIHKPQNIKEIIISMVTILTFILKCLV